MKIIDVISFNDFFMVEMAFKLDSDTIHYDEFIITPEFKKFKLLCETYEV